MKNFPIHKKVYIQLDKIITFMSKYMLYYRKKAETEWVGNEKNVCVK
jgi:hypothetical protein